MSTASDISVVRVPLPVDRASDGAAAEPGVAVWTPTPVAPARRPSPATLASLGVVAGVVAMMLGGLAVFSAVRPDGVSTVSETPSTAPNEPDVPAAERRALALLAKPSTERILFRGSGGDLVLAVGSGGRAALVMRGLEPAPATRPYRAWVVGPERVVPAGQFLGDERVALLPVPVAPGASVVVATDRRAALRPGGARFIATRP